MINWQRRPDGIVILTLSTGTIGAGLVEHLTATVERLEGERDTITGVVLTSANDTFLLGMDLKDLTTTAPDPRTLFALTEVYKQALRRLETLGRPVVAALNGSALGGGLELALACHHRIAVDRPDARFGLPEVTLGLLPGGGGVVRAVRLLGVAEALTQVLARGQRLRPAAAVETGIVDALVSTVEDLVPAAVTWIEANPDARQPWDRPGFRVRVDKSLLPAFPANLRKQLKGADYPAAKAIMCAAVEGLSVDFDTAVRIEGRWFASLIGTPVQKSMTKAFFFDLQYLNKGGSRPSGVPRASRPGRVGVVGAGMMGAGIATACAKQGVDTVLVDVSLELATKGAAGNSRITPTADLADLAGCDVIIEAVFEDLALKHETYQRLADIAPDALLASNTSTLPISSLATTAADPARFIGLHFFSPVARMPLVEIIRGKETSDATLAHAYDLVRLMNKTPIVVNDSRGFFTSRIFGSYLLEALAMVAEGVPPASIEQAAQQAGYPVGPLAVIDEVTLTLPRRTRAEARKAGVAGPPHPGEAVLDRMVDEYGRTGKSAGSGFYDYPPDGSGKRLWPGLAVWSNGGADQVPFVDLQERLLFAEAIEAVKCHDEGVITGIADGNIGSIFGLGFPAWTGGVFQYVESYPGGFAARASHLAARYGDRFTPPDSLTRSGWPGTSAAPGTSASPATSTSPGSSAAPGMSA